MANEKRLIDVLDEIRKIQEVLAEHQEHANSVAYRVFESIKTVLEQAPTVDAVEVVHGRWLMDKLEIGNPYDGNSTMIADIGNCSVCGYRCEMLPVMNYCPNCGAKMDGERKDDVQ